MKAKKTIMAITSIFIIGFFIFKTGTIQGENTTAKSQDLKILKSQVTSTAKFYPYKAGSIYMEVIAVKASDNSIRTALNTCQVCFNSGRGYYTQQGDELICNNCGNRFKIDQIEKIKFGCNPIPITNEYKTEDGKNIIISKDFLAQTAKYFANWKKN